MSNQAPLSELMARHRWLEIKSACRIIIQVLSALECLHARGVIHQNLKPENIIVSGSYGIKIADLGSAYYSGSGFSRSQESASRGTGASGYTSPQKFYGDVSTESDVYSAGVIFYKMLTGHLPYSSRKWKGTVLKESCPLPSRYNRSIPPPLINVIMKAIALRKEDRFPSAASFRSALLKKGVFK